MKLKGVLKVQAVIRGDQGQVLQVISLEPKNFKTGSRGFYGNGKIPINGKRYQGNMMLVEIGSKKKK